MSIQEARSHPRPARPSRREITLRVLAVLVFALLVADVGIPLVTFSDAQWDNEPLVTVLSIAADLLQLVWLALVLILGILAVRRYPTAWRIVWALWSFRLILASVVVLLAFYLWWLVLDLLAGPYAYPVYLPSWSSPLGVADVVLCAIGVVVLIPEIFWRTIRGARAARATPPEGR